MKILITGATSGIGFRVGVDLIKKGHFIYFTTHYDKEIMTAKDRLKELGLLENASIFKLDITNSDDRKLIYDLDIDVLICNAAVGYGGSVLDIDISTLEDNFKVNVFSNIKLIQMYLGHLFLTKKKGKVVVISSIAGIIPIPFLGSYSSSKAALSSLITCLKYEIKLINDDIKIKLVEPGIYNTGFNDVMIENKEESKYFADIDDLITEIEKELFYLMGSNKLDSIAKKIVKAVESDSNKFIYRAPFFQSLVAKLYLILK